MDAHPFLFSGEPILKRMYSFTAAPGETIGVIGGTGSGKTTLINLIPRLYDAADGRVTIDGADVRDYDAETLRRLIGIVPQKSVLFKGTIRSNLLWGREDASDDELWQALELAQVLGYEIVWRKRRDD